MNGGHGNVPPTEPLSGNREKGLLQADWPAPANVHAFTTLRHGAGVSPPPFDQFNLGLKGGDDATTVQRNREDLVQWAGLPAMPCWLRQVHGVEVVRIGDRPRAGEPQADAAVTATPGTVLAVLTADCLPVVLSAVAGNEVAVAHAGWRGLAAGVLERTVSEMRTPATDLLAWLGPAAGPEAYEVGVEVHEAFVATDAAAAAAFLPTRPGHWRVDLYALARLRLQAAGVHRVHGGGLCTIGDAERFYSHRRDRRTGRMATVAWFDPLA